MTVSPEQSEKENWLTAVLRQFLSSDNLLGKPLLAVIRRLHSQRYLFVIGIVILVVIALTIVYLVKPEVASPFYAALGVVLILALVAMGDAFLRSLPPEVVGERSLLPQEGEENTMGEVPHDCEPLKRQLEEARRTLCLLEQKAAAIPRLERPISLTRDLEDHQRLVKELVAKLDECLARIRQTGKNRQEATDTSERDDAEVMATAQVFLSYTRQDGEQVEWLYQKLSDVGFRPWMDKKDILPGETWESSIRRAIRTSDFFLACLSTNSVNRRGFLQKEIKRALAIWQEKLDSDIYLIPVRLDECEAPESLCDFQWVDLFEENGWERLVRAIKVGVERSQE